MAVLPGWDTFTATHELSDAQNCAQVIFTYLIALLFSALLVLCVHNIWQYLIRQGRWRNTPLLVFYVFALISIVLRILSTLWFYTLEPWAFIAAVLQPVIKLCVGLIQAWMIFQISIRLRVIMKNPSNQEIHRSEKLNKIGELLVYALVIMGTIVFTTCACLSTADSKRVIKIPFEVNGRYHLYLSALSYGFLAMFVVMAIVNTILIVQIRKRNRIYEEQTNENFHTEQRTLLIVLAFFELSYLVRFAWDQFNHFIEGDFSYLMCSNFVFLIDGASFTALLYYHHQNFKPVLVVDSSVINRFSDLARSQIEHLDQMTDQFDTSTNQSPSVAEEKFEEVDRDKLLQIDPPYNHSVMQSRYNAHLSRSFQVLPIDATRDTFGLLSRSTILTHNQV